MSRVQLKVWMTDLATLQANLAEGEVGIAVSSSGARWVKRPDGQPNGELVSVGDAAGTLSSLMGHSNGIATLDATGHLDVAQLPTELQAALEAFAAATGGGAGGNVPGSVVVLDQVGTIPLAQLPDAVNDAVATADALYQQVGRANGLATLDSTGRMPSSQLPVSAVTTDKVGARNGVAGLDAAGKVPSTQLAVGGLTWSELGTGASANYGNSATLKDIIAVQGVQTMWATAPATSQGNVYSIVCSPVPTELRAPMTVRFVVPATNSGPGELIVNGLPKKPLTKSGAIALSPGDMPKDAVITASFDGERWQVVSGAGSAGAATLYYRDTFSPDGTQKAFTLTGAPSSAVVCWPYLDGVHQNGSGWSLLNRVVTFSEAPPAGTDTLEVVWLASTSIGALGGNAQIKSFVAGVDFTAGVTTTLALPEAPASAQSVEVNFDGITQLHSTWGLSGTSVLLSSPIPAGVREAEVRWLSVAPIAAPADGTVTPAAFAVEPNGAGGVVFLDESGRLPAADASFLTNVEAALGYEPVNSALVGAAGGIATLDPTGKVPASQLPGYVDDVLEVGNVASLPEVGESSKLYVTVDTREIYRWSGSTYVSISPSPGSTDSVPEGAANLYFTAQRAQAAVSSVTGNAGTATRLQTARAVGLSGDASGSVTFDGSSNATVPVVLAATGVAAGTYNNSATAVTPFTVDGKGRVTGIGSAIAIAPSFAAVTNKPSTLGGYGITDAAAATHTHTLAVGNGTSQQIAVGTNETLHFAAGSNVSIGFDEATNKVTFSANAGNAPFDLNFNAGWGSDWAGADLNVQMYDRVVLARSATFSDFVADLGSAPFGADLVIDVQKNGVSIFTTKPKFVAGTLTFTPGVIAGGSVACSARDVITFHVAQVGSSTKGQKLSGALKGQGN